MTTAILSPPARHVGLGAAVQHTLTLTWRSLLKIKTNMEDVIGLSLQPVMFLLIFVYVFGTAIGGSVHQYLQYVLPGLLVQGVLFATMGTGLMLNQDINAGVFDRFRSLPIARWAPLAGAILGDIARYMISIVVMLGVAMILGFRIETNPVAAAAACLLILGFALAMCWVSALIGLVVKTPQGVQMFGFIGIFPIVFTSNTLVPTAKMPGWLQAWVQVNPMTFLANAGRGLMVGGPVARSALLAMAWAVGIVVVFAPLAVRAYRRHS